MTIAYLVSRFPVVSETFIVRELQALADRGEFDLQLRSLFPAPPGPVHDVAAPWIPRLRRPHGAAVARGVGWALRRHPGALAGVLATVVAAHLRRPKLLVRALVTVAIACAHARELRDQGVRHVHAHYATYPALAAWVCRRLTGVTYSFTAHAHDLYVDRSMLERTIADAGAVVTISEFNRCICLEHRGASGTPVEVVHCGIDVSRYRFRPRGVPRSGPIRALCVASLQEYKGHRTLFEALAATGDDVDRVRLDLIGNGPLRGELERLATELGLGDRVRFLGGQPESAVRGALDAADLFVLPSVVARDGQMEGLPVALMEALACGVPTVSTRLSGIPEIVVDGRTGWLAEPGDAASLRRALLSAIREPDGGHDRAVAGRELVEEQFELAASVDRLAGVLRRCLDAREAVSASAASRPRPPRP